MYLHNLLTKPEQNLARMVLLQQIKVQSKNDWIKTVNRDLEDFQIFLDYDQICDISKPNFKKMVNEQCRKAYLKNIHENKQKLSKGSEISYPSLQLQTYLKSSQNLSVLSMKRIISVRLRDIYLKCNFPGSFSDKKCLAAPMCSGDDSNRHLFLCRFMSTANEISIREINYEQIFGDNVQVQEIISNMIFTRLEKRKSFIDPNNLGPADPRERKNPTLGIKKARTRTIIKQNNNNCFYLVSY